MVGSWAVATTFSNSEDRAVDHLVRQNFQTYLPKFLNGRSKKPTVLFPGYLFVRLQDHWRSIFGTRGIIGLIMLGENPAIVQEKVVDDIQSRERNGFVILPEHVRTRFRKGKKVTVKCGPLYGLVGVVQHTTGTERVRVLFQLLGRATPVTMRADELSVV